VTETHEGVVARFVVTSTFDLSILRSLLLPFLGFETPYTAAPPVSMSTSSMIDHADEMYDLVIIGGGVVGLSILREATVHGGYKCALVERESDLLHWASGKCSLFLSLVTIVSPRSHSTVQLFYVHFQAATRALCVLVLTLPDSNERSFAIQSAAFDHL
jgi:hypothetical protein